MGRRSRNPASRASFHPAQLTQPSSDGGAQRCCRTDSHTVWARARLQSTHPLDSDAEWARDAGNDDREECRPRHPSARRTLRKRLIKEKGMKYVVPARGSEGFRCRSCGVYAHQHWQPFVVGYEKKGSEGGVAWWGIGWEAEGFAMSLCENCRQPMIRVTTRSALTRTAGAPLAAAQMPDEAGVAGEAAAGSPRPSTRSRFSRLATKRGRDSSTWARRLSRRRGARRSWARSRCRRRSKRFG